MLAIRIKQGENEFSAEGDAESVDRLLSMFMDKVLKIQPGDQVARVVSRNVVDPKKKRKFLTDEERTQLDKYLRENTRKAAWVMKEMKISQATYYKRKRELGLTASLDPDETVENAGDPMGTSTDEAGAAAPAEAPAPSLSEATPGA